jgi:hypothetical protein
VTHPLTLRTDEYTAKQASLAAGVDWYTFRRLLHAGRGPAYRVVHGASHNARLGARGFYAIRRAALRAWVAEPDVWPYVRPTRMGDPLLRHLMERAQRGSAARWWTAAELAAGCYVAPDTISKWRAAGWPTGARWLRVEGRRGLLWWNKATPPQAPYVALDQQEARHAAAD